jgi:hypothetical protein
MKLAFVCSPLRNSDQAEATANVDYARNACLTLARCGLNPVAPHLLYPQYLNDNDEVERKLGLALARDLLKRCDEIHVFTGRGVSEGMAAEIKLAHKLGKKIIYS